MTTFLPISASAVQVLARLSAKKAIVEQLRSEGRREMLVLPAEINAKVRAYLQAHPELYQHALERAQRLGLYDKPKRRKSAVMITPMPPCTLDR
jgi:hypothetical protein